MFYFHLCIFNRVSYFALCGSDLILLPIYWVSYRRIELNPNFLPFSFLFLSLSAADSCHAVCMHVKMNYCNRMQIMQNAQSHNALFVHRSLCLLICLQKLSTCKQSPRGKHIPLIHCLYYLKCSVYFIAIQMNEFKWQWQKATP